MPIKNLTLGLALLLAVGAEAQTHPYRIKEGDTLSGLATRFHVRSAAIVNQNGLDVHAALRVGRVIQIPEASTGSDRAQHFAVPSGYVVRHGDNDHRIAKKLGVKLHDLHAVNPNVDWDALQIGHTIRIPGHKAQAVQATLASYHERPAKAKSASSAKHTVRDGENDWIIAHRAGITTVALKRMNPGVNLSRLHAGQKINVPGSATSSSSSAVASKPRLHSRYAVINGDSVTIRRHANRSSEAITQVDAGTRVVVLDREGDWYRLRFPHGTEGWVRTDFLKSASAPKVAHHESHHSTYVASRSTRRSHKPSSDSGYQARLASFHGSGGNGDSSEILAKAQSMSGTRYRWGAMSRSATDCSGFTSQVFRSQGYKIPRTSSEQSTAGIAVHAKDLKPGDLVFFHTRRGARVTHVGIYMGSGKFIHASSAGGHVQVNRLDEGYYQQRLVAARRVAKSNSSKKAHSLVAAAKKVQSVTSPEPPSEQTEPGQAPN